MSTPPVTGPVIGVVDGHNDLPWALREHGVDARTVDLREPQPQWHTDLPRLRRGGVAAQFWSVYVRTSFEGADAVAATLEQIDTARTLIDRHEDLQFVTDATTLAAVLIKWRTFGTGPVASMLGAEGAHSLNGSIGVLRAFFRLGVRYLTLAHHSANAAADSATADPVHGGLSDFGREVVAEMNRIGMIVDLSHVSPEVMHQTLDLTTAPVVFTHSCARALHDHPRNVGDDVLARLADNGGVCMVNAVPHHLADEGRASVAVLADHVEHVREVAGLEHVGIGGDFDGIEETVPGFADVAAYPALWAELASRGWSRDELAAVAHANLLRAWTRVEAAASDEVSLDAIPASYPRGE